MEDKYIAKATERIFLSPIKIAMLPEVVDMYLPEEGVAHNIALVSIDKTYPGQAYKVGNALWGAGQMMFNKIMVVTNHSVNVKNVMEVARVMSQNFNPLSDTLLGRGPLDILDHSSDKPAFGGKILIDATEKLPEEINGFVEPQVYDAEFVAEELSKVNEVFGYNVRFLDESVSLAVVSVDKEIVISVRNVAHSIALALGKHLPKIVVFVDKEIPLKTIELVAWYTAANIDPNRDCFFADIEGVKANSLFVDGTRKTMAKDGFSRDWPNIVTSSLQTVKDIDTKWKDIGFSEFVESPSVRFAPIVKQDGAIAK